MADVNDEITGKLLGKAIRLFDSGWSNGNMEYVWIADQPGYPFLYFGSGDSKGIRLAPLTELTKIQDGAPDWSVFNVIPGLSGTGISLQAGPDSEAYLTYPGRGYYICDRPPSDQKKLEDFQKASSFYFTKAFDGSGGVALALAHDQPKVISADMKPKAMHPVQTENWSKGNENRAHASFKAWPVDPDKTGVRVSPKWVEIASFTNPTDTEQKGITFETTRTVGITNSRGSSSTTQNAWKVALSATGGPVTAMIEASGSVSKTESESVSFAASKTSKITIQQATVGPHQTIRLWERAVDVETSTVSFSGAEALALKITYDNEPPPDLGDMGSRFGTETDVSEPTRS